MLLNFCDDQRKIILRTIVIIRKKTPTSIQCCVIILLKNLANQLLPCISFQIFMKRSPNKVQEEHGKKRGLKVRFQGVMKIICLHLSPCTEQ